MPDVRMDTIGQIVAGDATGHFLRITYDPDDTGGYYILTCENDRFDDKTFDNWVENRAALAAYFRHAGWEVNWQYDDREP